MTNFPKLIGGSQGPVQAHHMNAVFDAASRVLSAGHASTKSQMIPPSGLWVQLLEMSTYGGVSAWSWRAVSKGASAIDDDNGDLLRSSMWPDGDGLAVELGSTSATANGYALIYPLAAYDGKSWFAFSAGGSGTTQKLLPILSATGTSPPFAYTSTLAGESIEIINQYEQEPYGYGQSLTFATGTISVAPCEGSVICSFIGGAWYFSEKNPETPDCAT